MGNLTTRPRNGVVLVLELPSGRLFVKVIHKAVWNLPRHLRQSAVDVAAREIVALLRLFDERSRPCAVLVNREQLLAPLDAQLLANSSSILMSHFPMAGLARCLLADAESLVDDMQMTVQCFVCAVHSHEFQEQQPAPQCCDRHNRARRCTVWFVKVTALETSLANVRARAAAAFGAARLVAVNAHASTACAVVVCDESVALRLA